MKSHLKRLVVPRTWDIKRKKTIFIMRPHPGGQKKELTVPLQVLLREILGVAKTAREVRHVLQNKEVLVNGKRRKEVKFPVGLMDVVQIPDIKTTYRILINNKGKLYPSEITGSEISAKLHQIAGKTSRKKGVQLNFSDGGNLLVEKDTYKTGDAVMVDFTKKKITSHAPFDKKSLAYMIGGSNVGQVGSIMDVKGKNIIIKTKEGEFETARKYAFVVGQDKPLIKIQND